MLLAGASITWKYIARKSGGLAVPIASHIGADLGVVLVAWLRIAGY
jgi:membrane protease YdiL (CAAX protease family)